MNLRDSKEPQIAGHNSSRKANSQLRDYQQEAINHFSKNKQEYLEFFQCDNLKDINRRNFMNEILRGYEICIDKNGTIDIFQKL